jgi:uncharacterized protein (UPF0261 family)
MKEKPDKTVAIIATLDTKGPEAAYLKSCVEAAGYRTLVLDTGILGGKDLTLLVPDFSADEIARKGGEDRAQLVAQSSEKGVRDRGIRAMAKGAAKILRALYEESRFRSVVGIGGAQGTEICTTAMRVLPLGVPKVMVSTVASGKTPFGIYTGTRDITIMHSVVDILGVNSLTRRILSNAAGAAVGMAEATSSEVRSTRMKVGITIYGTTTPGGLATKGLLEQRGYEVIAFHPNGTGGLAMEELATEGFLHGLLDLTTHEVTDELFGGIHAANEERLVVSGQAGVPRLLVPGSADFMTFAEREKVPEIYRDHPFVPHNPHITLVRASADQMTRLATVVAERLNEARGPAAVAIPRQGFSFYNREGLLFFDEKANDTYVQALRTRLRSHIPVYEFDAHINDPEFAAKIVPLFDDLMEKVRKEKTKTEP